MCVCVCVCVCFNTVWYICTPVACDSRYTRLIDRYHNFASIVLLFEKCSYFRDCFFYIFRQHCYLRQYDGVYLLNLLKWSRS